MLVSTVALTFAVLGVTILSAGLITANVATVQMSRCLSDRFQKAERLRWWSAVGNSGTLIIQEYKQFVWKDKKPEHRLRLGYRLIVAGLATLLGASVLGQVLQGKV